MHVIGYAGAQVRQKYLVNLEHPYDRIAHSFDCICILQAALVSELRSEAAALEAALSDERFRVEKLMSELANKDSKMLEQGEAIRRMAEMAKRVRAN